MELKIEYLNKEDLRPYANNAKVHTAEQVEQIKNSIREFGFNDPIAIWHDNEIIEGHGRLLAAMEMEELEQIPVIRLDDLSDEQRRAYMLVHNKLTMNTDFDFDLLNEELESILDIDMTEFGFSVEELVEKIEEEKPEVKFSEILGEENNYIVLQFKTDVDWLNAQSVFGLETVKSYSTRKDGVVTKSMTRKGIARVLDGAKALREIVGEV